MTKVIQTMLEELAAINVSEQVFGFPGEAERPVYIRNFGLPDREESDDFYSSDQILPERIARLALALFQADIGAAIIAQEDCYLCVRDCTDAINPLMSTVPMIQIIAVLPKKLLTEALQIRFMFCAFLGRNKKLIQTWQENTRLEPVS